jgi:phage protein U
MLYMIGSVQIDTYPFSIDSLSRKTAADIALKPLLNGRKSVEFMGPGDDVLTLSGKILPVVHGGRADLEKVRGHIESGTKLPVMQGNGVRLGMFVIKSLDETHQELLMDGTPFVIRHRMELLKVDEDAAASQAALPDILSLFDGIG